MKRIPTLLFTCCAMAAFGGCGGDDNKTDTGATTPPPADTGTTETGATETTGGGEAVEIKIENFAYEPADAQVKVGQTIKWTNKDQAPHDVDSQSGERIKTEVMQKDGTAEYTPKKAGKVSYICSIHPNMKATLTVTG